VTRLVIVPEPTSKQRVAGSSPARGAMFEGSIPDTWFTDYSGDIVNTFSGTKGFGAGLSLTPWLVQSDALFLRLVNTDRAVIPGSDCLGFGSTLVVAPHWHHVFRRRVPGIAGCDAGSIPASSTIYCLFSRGFGSRKSATDKRPTDTRQRLSPPLNSRSLASACSWSGFNSRDRSKFRTARSISPLAA
jgi:hypothetical protein